MENTQFDLTVAICVYNGEKYITETLDSLYRQTFRDFHLLIVDDCSTDRTLSVVQDFLQKHDWENSTIISLPRNSGLARARKYAEGVIKTDLVMFFDADDIARPSMLAKLHAAITLDQNCMGVSGYCKYIDSHSNEIGGGIFLGPTTREAFFKKARAAKLMFLPPPMFRLKDAKAAGGRAVDGFPDGRVRYQDMCEDLDLWTRMSDFYVDGKYFLVVPEVLFLYRKHASSVSTTSQAMNDRMRHIKTNVKRRREGLPDQSFNEFLAALSQWARFRHFGHDYASDYYKRAGFSYLKKQYLQSVLSLALAAMFSPTYVVRKLRNNVFQPNNNE